MFTVRPFVSIFQIFWVLRSCSMARRMSSTCSNRELWIQKLGQITCTIQQYRLCVDYIYWY